MAPIVLHHGDWRAEIAPETGGALLSLDFRGHPILRRTDQASRDAGNVRRSACYPMVPYANRIADGRFTWNGIDYRLAMNFGESPHPLHGVGWQRAWSLSQVDDDFCALDYRHLPSGDDALAWPFPFSVRQEFQLADRGLTLRLALRNDDDGPRPLGLGWHPFFHKNGGEILCFTAGQVWSNDRRCLPEKATTPQGAWNHADGQTVGALALDHDYTGWLGEARIVGPFQITLRSNLANLRVFTPAEAGYFAVEPVSHGANALNRSEGMGQVPSGGTIEGEMSIAIEEAA